MRESEYRGLLDREQHVTDVYKHYQSQIELFHDLTNYGSNLIPRAYNSGSKGMTEAIVIGVLLKQVVSMSDALEVLIGSAAVHPAFLQARTAYEASLYIDWILSGESERRAKAYYVSNRRNERIWALRGLEGTREERAFTPILEEIGLDITTSRPNLAEEAALHLEEVNRVLSQEELAEINALFEERRSRSRRGFEPYWYSIFGVHSIRQIAREVGRLPEYDIFYSLGSEVTHSSSYRDHVRFVAGTIRFKPIRYLDKLPQLLQFFGQVVLKTYSSILNRYRPGELSAFSRKYIEDWRQPYQSIPSIRYVIRGEEGDGNYIT